MPSNKIQVTDYNPDWRIQFASLKEALSKHLFQHIYSIEHIGSTSVVGLAAKPIIDMDIVIENDKRIKAQVIALLQPLGYHHIGNLGISGREAFRRESDLVPLDGSNRIWPEHHLYLCENGSQGLRNHLALRDFLRTTPDAVAAYGNLKKELAARFPNDIDAYVDGKTDFIISILKQTGMQDSEADKIAEENKL